MQHMVEIPGAQTGGHAIIHPARALPGLLQDGGIQHAPVDRHGSRVPDAGPQAASPLRVRTAAVPYRAATGGTGGRKCGQGERGGGERKRAEASGEVERRSQVSAITSLSLVSGLHISAPLEQLRAFCAEEYVYYDAIPSAAPDHVLPLDVLVTVAVNSFVNDAKSIRLVHRGLAQRCDPLLARIPEDVNLLESPSALAVVGDLLAAALDAKRVLVPVATKVLHRKRRALIPMLDSVIIEHYRPGYAA